MHVARCADRNAQLFAEPDDLAVEIAQLFFVFRHALAQHERVVADGLNFKIVVEPRDPFEFRVVFAVHHRAEQFARLAGRADDDALAVFLQNFARGVRLAAEIVEMAFRNDLVQVGDAVLFGGQQNDVIGIADGAARQRGIDFVQAGDALLLRRVEHAVEHVGRRARVVHGSVRVFKADAQRFADRAKPVALETGVHSAGKLQRVDNRHMDFNPQSAAFFRQERIVKFCVVRRKRRPADKFQQFRDFDFRRVRVGDHGVGDVR